MIMKWLNFNSIIGMAVLSLLFYTENVAAQTDKNDTKQKIDTIQTTQPEYSKYDKRIHRFRKGWNSLIPTHNKIQYAGNNGNVLVRNRLGLRKKRSVGNGSVLRLHTQT